MRQGVPTPSPDEQAAAEKPVAGGRLHLVRLRGRFDQPLLVAAPAGDRRNLFVVEETGRIWVVSNGRRLRRPFVDLSRRVSRAAATRHAGGLLGLAFAPDYHASGRFYVHYTDWRERIRVESFRRSDGDGVRASLASRRTLLVISRPSREHAGGQLVFGRDGMLYVGVGDGGPAGDPRNHAQNLGLLLGKILRIVPRPNPSPPYMAPADNPFAGVQGARSEIWAYGVRNPYRFAFGPTGDVYIADPGQDRREEIDHAAPGEARGANWGWSCFEATRRFNPRLRCPGARAPILDYPDSRGRCAVVGGVVAGPAAGRLARRFVYGDFCTGEIRTLSVRGTKVHDRATGLRVAQLTGFGQDGRGRVYVTALDGRVFRITTR